MCVRNEVNKDVIKQDLLCNANGSHVVIFLVVWFYFTSQICHCGYVSGCKNIKMIRNLASLEDTRLDEPLFCTVAETVLFLYLEAVDFSSCGCSDPFSIGHETLMRHALMSFHILSWSFMLICFTGELLYFFCFTGCLRRAFRPVL